MDFFDFSAFSDAMYECGAILGSAKCNELRILMKMFTNPGSEEEMIRQLQEKAKRRLEGFTDSKPKMFFHFIPWEELGEGAPIDKLDKKRISLEKAVPLIESLFLEGIGFGSSFPELTDKMVRAGTVSLPQPETKPQMRLEKGEKAVFYWLAEYASEYYPELLEPLNLSNGYEARDSNSES